MAVDNYNRHFFTQGMPNRTAQATLEAFRKIIRANAGIMPNEITVDLGNEYAWLEQEIANKEGVLRRKNMQAANTLAAVDRVIGKLMTILSGYSLTDWSGALRRATATYNDKSHSYLLGSAPGDVKGSNLLQYELDRIHGDQIKHNNDKWRAKAIKLRDAGAFRIPRPRDTWERIDASNLEKRFSMLMDLKVQMSSLAIRPIRSKPPLQYLLEALILALALKQVQEGDGEQDKRRCSRTMPEI